MAYSYDRRVALLTEPFDARRLERIQKDVEGVLGNYDKMRTERDHDQVFRAAISWRQKLEKDSRAVQQYLRDAAMADPKVKNLDRQLDIWRKKMRPLFLARVGITPPTWEYWSEGGFAKENWRKKLEEALDGFPAMIKFWKGLAKRRKIRPETPDVSERNMAIEGFKATLVGFDANDADHVEGLNKLKAALKTFKSRASKHFPVMIKRMVPMTLRFDVKDMLGAPAGRLGDNSIDIYPMNIHSVTSFVHTIAHELAHHHGRNLIGHNAWARWVQLFRADWGTMDLREYLAKWSPGKSFWDLDKDLRKDDPVLALQAQSITFGHNKAAPQELRDNWTREGIETYLAGGGDPKIKVPKSPTTPYGSSSPDEALAEALSYLIAYGPKAVHPGVRNWLNIIMPGQVKLASLPS